MNGITPFVTGKPLPSGGMSASVQERPLEPNLFFQPAMLDVALEHLAPEGVVPVHGVPIHVARGRYGPLPTPTPLMVWHHPYSMVGLPLITEANPPADLERLAAAITGTFRGRSVLLMPRLRTDGPFWPIFRSWLEKTGRRYAVLEEYDRAGHRFDADDPTRLDELRSKKSASAIRSKRRKLEKLGVLLHTTATHGNGLRQAIDEFLDVEASGWKGSAGTAMKTAGHASFIHNMVKRLSEAKRVRVDIKKLDDRPIAGTVFLRDGSDNQPIWMSWKIAYEERYAAQTPGNLVLYEVTEQLMAGARQRGTSIAFDSLTAPDSVVFNRLWPKQRWHLADVLVDLQPGGSTAFGPILMAERARLKAGAAARSARDMVRAALRKRR